MTRNEPRDRGNESGLSRKRLAAGLTQRQLAERIGVTEVTVARWEGGARAPSVKYLRKLADVLGCKIDDLI